MTIIKRICANCAAFNPSATDDEEACGDLFYFTEHHGTPQALTRAGADSGADSGLNWCAQIA